MSENFFDSRHYRALSRLHPLQMDLEEYVVCKELDRALESADGVYREIFPSSAIATLEKWENLYELGHSGTIEARRAALLEAINRDSGIAERHYKALAASMGFEIDIVKPPRMLRAGLGRAGFEIYDPDEQYTWTVTSDHPQHGIYRIVELLEAEKIPFTQIRWQLSKEKFLELEDGKLLKLESDKFLILEDENE